MQRVIIRWQAFGCSIGFSVCGRATRKSGSISAHIRHLRKEFAGFNNSGEKRAEFGSFPLLLPSCAEIVRDGQVIKDACDHCIGNFSDGFWEAVE